MSATLKKADGSVEAPVTVDTSALNYEPFLTKMQDGDTLEIHAEAYKTITAKGRRRTDDEGNPLKMRDLAGNELIIGDELLVAEVLGAFSRAQLADKKNQTLELQSKASEIIMHLTFDGITEPARWFPFIGIYSIDSDDAELLLTQFSYEDAAADPNYKEVSRNVTTSVPPNGANPYPSGGGKPEDRDFSKGLDLKISLDGVSNHPRTFKGGRLRFALTRLDGKVNLENITTANWEQGEIVDLGVVILKPR